jgi:hypothetical protein
VDAAERDVLVAAAVADNVAWCDAVCRSLGLATSRPPGLWAVAQPPPLFPHLITLAPQVTAARVVSELDPRTVSWVKDSFASLRLAQYGFSVVVQASWLHHTPGSADGDANCSVVRPGDELARWTAASGTTGIIPARLLADPAVRLVTVHKGGRPVGGAALSISEGVVGISNVFGAGASPDVTWEALVSAVGRLVPGRALVGYEQGEGLDAAMRAGFVSTGRLRIWLRPAP